MREPADPFSRLPPPSLPVDAGPRAPLQSTPPPPAHEQAMPFPPMSAAPPPVPSPPPPLRVIRTQPAPSGVPPTAEESRRLGAPLSDAARSDVVPGVVVAFNQPMAPAALPSGKMSAASPNPAAMSAGAPPSVTPSQGPAVPHASEGAPPSGTMSAGAKPAAPASPALLHLEPLPPGQLRWIDASTLAFEPDGGRMPLATTYSVTIPAGVRSASGEALAEETSWTFSTARPALLSSNLAAGMPLDAVLELELNARMDPALALQSLHVEPPVELRALASDDPRRLRLQPVHPLPPAHSFELKLSADLRSAEGPLTLGAPQALGFSTYGPLRVVGARCAWGGTVCPPGGPILVETTTAIAPQKLAALVRVRGVRNVRASPQPNGVLVFGDFPPSGAVEVHVAAGLLDVFGQKLAQPFTAHVPIGPLSPVLDLEGATVVAVDARRPRALHALATNTPRAKVRVEAVEASGLVAAVRRTRYGAAFDGPVVPMSTQRDRAERIAIPLPAASAFSLVQVSAPDGTRKIARVVQVTGLGITAALSDDEIVALVTRLEDAAPMSAVPVRLFDAEGKLVASGTTGETGLARLHGPARLESEGPFALVAGTSFLYLDGSTDQGSWLTSFGQKRDRAPVVTGGAWSERGIYRPGETAHIFAVVRSRARGAEGALSIPSGPFTFRAHGSDGQEFARGQGALSAFGTLQFALPLPATLKLGRVLVEVAPFDLSAAFEVQEFRAPAHRVAVEFAQGPVFLGGRTTAHIEAATLFGAPLAGAAVRWSLVATPGWFSPAGHPGFIFMDAGGTVAARGPMMRPTPRPPQMTGDATLDAQGRLDLPVDLACESAGPCEFSLEVEVVDRTGQAVAGRASTTAHAASMYAGLRIDPAGAAPGTPLQVTTIAVDTEGRRVQREVLLRLLALGDDGEETEIARSPAPLLVPKEGRYKVSASVRDSEGREAFAAVFGSPDESAARRGPKTLHTIQLVADKASYAPGDVAKLSVKAPFASGTGLLVVAKDGFADVRRISAGEPLEVKIREGWIPGVEVSIALVTGGEQAGFATGAVTLHVSRESRRLQVVVAPARTEVAPGDEVDIAVHTGAQSNVALAIVDEGVLAMTGYETPDVLDALWPEVAPQAGIRELRALFAPTGGVDPFGTPDNIIGGIPRPPPAMAMAIAGGAPPPAAFSVRSFFALTAFFDGALATDAAGTAHARVKLPQGITAYRLFAVAVDRQHRAGAAEASLRTRLPLLLRPALPRFLNSADMFEAAAVVQSLLPHDAEVEVLARGANVVIDEPARRRITLRGGEAQTVRFKARPAGPGPAKVQFALAGAGVTDAVEVTLPVAVPAAAEAYATYGATESAVALPLSIPANALPGFGGLSLSFASSALAGLQDAVQYLAEYPFHCLEQRTSRLVALGASRQLVRDFRLVDESRRAALVADDLAHLAGLQLPDGGLAFWEGSARASPLGTAWAVLGLTRAAAAGEPVDAQLLARARNYLRTRPQAPRDEAEKAEWGPPVRALAQLALAGSGEADAAELGRLYDVRRELPLFARAHLLEAIVRSAGAADPRAGQLARDLHDAAVETAGAVHFAEPMSGALRTLFHSEDRTDAIVLSTLIAVGSTDPLVGKLARGLSAERVRGRWLTTQSNAWALLALSAFHQREEAAEPRFTAGAWLGAEPLASHAFGGHSLDTARAEVPMSALRSGTLTLAREGQGRLYYRVGLRAAFPADNAKALERGFSVSREYLDELGAPLPRDPGGAHVAQAGSTVRVRVRVVAPDRRYYAAIVDPLPAGLEPVDRALRTSASQRLSSPLAGPAPARRGIASARFPSRAGSLPGVAQSPAPPWNALWIRPTWDAEELRDDRVQIFADALPGGVYVYEYAARATTAGRFLAPPTHAEEMYAPETFGRGAPDVLVIR